MNEPEYTAEQIQSLHDEAVSTLKQATEYITDLRQFDIGAVDQELEENPELAPAVTRWFRSEYDSWSEGDLFCHYLDRSPAVGESHGRFWWMLYTLAWSETHIAQAISPLTPPARMMLQTSAYHPSRRFFVGNVMQIEGWDVPSRELRLAFDVVDHFASSWDLFTDKYAGPGIGQILEWNPDDVDAAEQLLRYFRMDVQDANEVLFPCTDCGLLCELLEYETAWLLHAYCGYPEPFRRSETGELWLTKPSGERPRVAKTVDGSSRKDGGDPSEEDIQTCIDLIEANHSLWGDNPSQKTVALAAGGAYPRMSKAAKIAIRRRNDVPE